jgi:hypothetical protein
MGEGGGMEAAGVTAARVRCSAWLGDVGWMQNSPFGKEGMERIVSIAGISASNPSAELVRRVKDSAGVIVEA